jgi:hypothetical protein
LEQILLNLVKFAGMLQLEDFSPLDDSLNAKATVHQNGKIGFSGGANKLMSLDEVRNFRISRNTADSNDSSLYMIPAAEDDEKAFKISKAGNYYYLRARHILDKMKVSYKDNTVIFDISEDSLNGSKYYKLTMRIRKRKQKENQ